MQKLSSLFGRTGNQMFQMAYIYAQMKRGIIPDIYVQDEAYFKENKDDIKQLFGRDIGFTDAIAVHCRRGDYVNNPFYVDLTDTDYYKRAMAEFPNERFIIFSDDIEWCKTYFIGDYWFNEEDEIAAMNTMASCKGHIIANSSYSWWGAYLSPHNGKVIAPKAWYTDGIIRTKVPKEWITM